MLTTRVRRQGIENASKSLVLTGATIDVPRAVDILTEYGVLILRHVLPEHDVANLARKAEAVFSQPNLAGSIGYYQKDAHKHLYDALLLGKEAVDAVTQSQVIELVEGYLGGDVYVTELMLKKDLGHDLVYFPYHRHTGTDRVVFREGAFGTGMMVYLHDTKYGAFCYAPGTHVEDFGVDESMGEMADLPGRLQSEIRSRIRRMAGQVGDIVLFDERGWHGPEQPVSVPRTVIITGYQRGAYFGNTTRSPAPVLLTDLGHLDSKQLAVLGLGVGTRVPYEEYHIRGFERTPGYAGVARALGAAFRNKGLRAQLGRLKRSLVP